MANTKESIVWVIASAKEFIIAMSVEILKSALLIFKPGVPEMLKSLFQAIESILRASIYFLILVMGLSIAGLGTYTIIFFSIRMGQFLYELLFKNKWL